MLGRDAPRALAVVAPLFHHRHQPFAKRFPGAESPVAGAAWPRLLLARRTEQVLADGLRRLKIAGFTPLVRDARSLAVGVDPVRLAAAGLVPLRDQAVASLLDLVTSTAHPKEITS